MRIRIKDMFTAIALAAAVLVVFRGGLQAFRLERSLTGNAKVEGGTRLVLVSGHGRVGIVAGDDGDISVRADVRIKAPGKSKALRMFKDLALDIKSLCGVVEVKAELPRIRQDAVTGWLGGERSAISIHYTVCVPRRTDIDVKAASGDIVIDGVEGIFDLTTKRGHIEIASGFAECRASTGSGSIDCAVTCLPDSGMLELKSVGGNINLTIPGTIDARLKAEAVRGRIDTGALDIGFTERKRSSAKGRIGEGKGMLHLRAINGDILLKSM